MLEQFIGNMEYYYEANKLHKLLAWVLDKKIVLINIAATNPPETLEKEEMEKILSCVLNEVKWDAEESLQGVEAEYFYDWEKDVQSGAIKKTLFDYPGFDGVVGVQPMSPFMLIKINDFIKQDLEKEGKL